MASAVQNAEFDDAVRAADEKYMIRKSLGEHAANFRLAAEAGESERIFGGAGDGGFDLGEKIVAEARLLAVIPDGGVGDVYLRFHSDDDTNGGVVH